MLGGGFVGAVVIILDDLRICRGCYFPDNKVYGANIVPTWVLSAPGGSHVGPMNLAIMVLWNTLGTVCKQCLLACSISNCVLDSRAAGRETVLSTTSETVWVHKVTLLSVWPQWPLRWQFTFPLAPVRQHHVLGIHNESALFPRMVHHK